VEATFLTKRSSPKEEPMKRFWTLVLLSTLLLSACAGGAQPTEAPTAVPPTDTPVPTATQPPPTETPIPTLTPTSTPDLTATAAVQATAQAESVLAELDTLLADSGVDYKSGRLIWQQTDPVDIRMTGPQATDNFREMDGAPAADNFILRSQVTWNANGIIICGVIFRSEPDLDMGQQYQLYFYRLSGLPAYFIDLYESGSFKKTLTDARFSDQLDVSNDGVNDFVLVAQNEQFTFYLNGVRQGRYFDYAKTRSGGDFAFLAWQQSGDGSCKFENSWIWSLDAP
jgi:hypothetical protein